MEEKGYRFTGDEFLEKLDELKAATDSLEPVTQEYLSTAQNGEDSLKREARDVRKLLPRLFEPYHRIDEMAQDENLEVPVRFVDGGERYMAWMSLKGGSFDGIIPALEEIQEKYPMNISQGKIDYANNGMPLALIDYAGETVEAWRDVKANFWRVAAAGNALNGELDESPVEHFLDSEEPAYRKGAEKIREQLGN